MAKKSLTAAQRAAKLLGSTPSAKKAEAARRNLKIARKARWAKTSSK